jgi:hypothetical protein
VNKIDRFIELVRAEVPIRIRYKDESIFMRIIFFFKKILNPRWLKQTTSTLGYTVYFPSRDFVAKHEDFALRVLAHETVHLLDSVRLSPPIFLIAYLFPQILSLGVFLFPWLGYGALFFLIFLLPLPAPFRYYFELRAFVITLLIHPSQDKPIDLYIPYFFGWNYYVMFPFVDLVKRGFLNLIEEVEQKKQKKLIKVILWYETANELVAG